MKSPILFLLWLTPLLSFAGGGFSGGGTGLSTRVSVQGIVDDKIIIADFLHFYETPAFKEILNKNAQNFQRLEFPSFRDSSYETVSFRLPEDSSSEESSQKLVVVDEFMSSTPYVWTKNILNQWSDMNLWLGLELTQAMAGLSSVIHFQITKRPIEINSLDNVVAYYEYNIPEKKYSTVFSLPKLQELDVWSQTALLLHEALRHRQLAGPAIWKGNQFSDPVLQKMTAMMVLCQPNRPLAQFLSAVLNADTQDKISKIMLGQGFDYFGKPVMSFEEVKNQCQPVDWN